MGIDVKNVTKIYKVKEKKGILDFEYKQINAVNDISFHIADGEFVGYIGSNGAGKSTTLKLLSGILAPSQGSILVNGISPLKDRKENAMQIGVVFGNRSRLLWDLPVIDTLNLYKAMYKVPTNIFNNNYKKLGEILGIEDFIKQPARQLSLGQRMKANIMLALMHNPKMLLLDEPTIGLDVLAKDNVRTILKEINKNMGVTIILTTHDMSDVQELCSRLIFIDNGRIRFDGGKEQFIKQFSHNGIIHIYFKNDKDIIKNKNFILTDEEGKSKKYAFDRNTISEIEAIKYIVNNYDVENILLEESTVEDIMRELLAQSFDKI